MAKMTDARLKEFGGKLFESQFYMRTLWQILAEHFYAERADFTSTRNIGQELADQLLNSAPLLMRRDLGNGIGAMLRDGNWFRMGVEDGEPDRLGQMWLDWATIQQRRYMYHANTNFTRSMTQADHDYVTFGQAAISIKPNWQTNQILYQTWHLRDCAWFDDEAGNLGGLVRKWNPRLIDLHRIFGDNMGAKAKQEMENEPFKTVEVMHFNIPVDVYGDEQMIDNRDNFPIVSIYFNCSHEESIETVPQREIEYVVPRFQTVAGSQYAYSPATVIGLPDARCLQAMTHTLMEAAERYARPPLVGTMGAVRGDVDLSPNGITYIDKEYDERLGAGLAPLYQDRGGFPIGLEMRDGIMEVLGNSFFLDKLRLPEINRDMTAYEVSERMKQFRREALPLFTPIEEDYNARVCERTFNVLFQMGKLGSPSEIPDSVGGRGVRFRFQSPLSEDEERDKAQRFHQTSQLLAEAVQFDLGVAHNVDFDAAFRDAAVGIGAPASYLRDAEDVAARRQQDAQAAQQEQMMPLVEKVAAGA